MIIEQTPVLRDVTTLSPHEKYTKERSDNSELKKNIREQDLKRYPHILEDVTAIDGMGCIEIYQELLKETGEEKWRYILCYVVKDITDEEIPKLIISLNTVKKAKLWEECEKALKYLQPEQQGKDLGGINRWNLAVKDSGVKGASGKTVQRYQAIKDYDNDFPGKAYISKIQDPSVNASIGKTYAEIQQEKRQKIKDAKVKRNGDRKYALDDFIEEAPAKHFCNENIQLYNQTNIKPWSINGEIQLLFTSPPYLNQRHYEDDLYNPKKLHTYLQEIYFAVKEGKKHLAKSGVVGINIGDAYKFGANYATVLRLIISFMDKLNLKFIYKMIWHKTNVLNKGKQEGKFGVPLYDYEEIIFFCQDESYAFNPIKYYDKGKNPVVTKTGGRHNPDGSKTEYKWGCSPAYDMFHQFINQQDFHNIITTGNAGSDSKLFTSEYGREHIAMMPLAIPLYPILCFSKPGDIVADCYAGSGTTLVTALLTGRKIFGIEKELKYFEPMCARISDTCKTINPKAAKIIELIYQDKFKAA